MADEQEKQMAHESSDEEPSKTKGEGKKVKIGKGDHEEPHPTAASSAGKPGPESKKRGRQSEKVDLSAVYQSEPEGSKNRRILKELVADRKKIQKEQNQASKKVKVEAQRQKRLVEKASRLSNEDLLEIFRQRHENQEQFKGKAKAKAKAKAKGKANTD